MRLLLAAALVVVVAVATSVVRHTRPGVVELDPVGLHQTATTFSMCLPVEPAMVE